MAGEWIKMRTNLWDDPRVSQLCDLTSSKEACIVGGLYWLWAAADEHTESGFMPGLSIGAIDRKTGIKGLGTALVQVGWIEDAADGITIIRFSEHNGASAKRRGADAKRKTNVRQMSASDADKKRTACGAREEKRREESSLAPNGARPPDGEPGPKAGYEVPDCPHETIVEAYHETLPMLPRVEVWSEGRKSYLRQRWREVCAEQRFDRDQGIGWFRDYFATVGRSEFLTGKARPTKGDRPFLADLEWLVRPANFVKVIEGKYQ
jgi:hypothetical protein